MGHTDVNLNITTPDAASFRSSAARISAAARAAIDKIKGPISNVSKIWVDGDLIYDLPDRIIGLRNSTFSATLKTDVLQYVPIDYETEEY